MHLALLAYSNNSRVSLDDVDDADDNFTTLALESAKRHPWMLSWICLLNLNAQQDTFAAVAADPSLPIVRYGSLNRLDLDTPCQLWPFLSRGTSCGR